MRISTLKLTISISFVACAFVMFLLCCFESLIGTLIVGALWVIFYFVMTAIYAKCPHCGQPLGKNYLQIETCPHCENFLD